MEGQGWLEGCCYLLGGWLEGCCYLLGGPSLSHAWPCGRGNINACLFVCLSYRIYGRSVLRLLQLWQWQPRRAGWLRKVAYQLTRLP